MPSFRPKKRLGQNFLDSKEIIGKIVNAIAPISNETIVEIGPGKGALTLPLAQSESKIIGVEFDRDIYDLLQSVCKDFKNVTLIQQDFLKFIPEEHGINSFKLCGNLPFNISSPVIDWIVKYHSSITKAVIMIQKEVALRLASEPGSKQWSPLAIFTQLYFEIIILFDVSPQHFKPSPEVTSTVVELIPKQKVKIKHYEKFEHVVRSSFKQRRKQLINNLSPGLIPSAQLAENILGELGLKRNVRAEEINTSRFLDLTAALVKHNLI